MGFEFLPIVTVVPFLILAIGVDDVFIFIHAFHLTNDKCVWVDFSALVFKQKLLFRLSVRERIADTLADAGPSISITSLTNLLSFSIGIFTSTPAIYVGFSGPILRGMSKSALFPESVTPFKLQTFCVFISVAVIYDYIYQIFFFSAVLTLGGQREARRGNAYLCCLTVPLPSKVRHDVT